MPTGIATKVVSSNPVHGESYSIQHYVIMFVSDLRQVWFSLSTPVSSTNKTDCHDLIEILLKVALNTILLSLTLDLQLLEQSVHITTKVVSSNPINDEGYVIQHYVIMFVSDLRQVGGFLEVLHFPPPIKLIASNVCWLLLCLITMTNIHSILYY